MTEESGKTPEEIRRDIEETREDLGDTVDALSAKTDVKARAKEKVGEQLDQLATRTREQPFLYLGAAATAGMVLGLMMRS